LPGITPRTPPRGLTVSLGRGVVVIVFVFVRIENAKNR
jgi:hypothetical protein